MTREDIIEMATKVYGECDWHESALHHLEAFAKLVEERTHTNNKARWYQEGVESEREACALIAEEWVRAYPHPSEIIANNILARGEA